MSYTIAKSLTISKGTMNCVCRSSNLFPAHYSYVSTPLDFKALLDELDNGCLQPIESANNYKWSYIDSQLDGLTGDERLDRFVELATAKEPKGKYAIWTDRGFVAKLTNRQVWFTYDPKLALKVGCYKAHVLCGRIKSYNPQVQTI